MKTPIRRLDSLTHNDTAATKLINDNFEALQQGIEDALSRSGKTPNFMDAPLDMNMNRIINIADPVDDYDLANKHYVDITVAAEALARQSADNTLQQHIDDEATARQNADGTLQGNIDAEETRAKAAEKAITDTLDTYGDIVTHDVDEFATAAQGAKADTALQPADLGDATLTIKKNSTTVGTFTANSKTDTDINLVIPTTAADVNALPDSTKYAASISLSLDSTSYILTVQLKDQDGSNLGTSATIDLPLESVIVSGSYDSVTKSIILVLDSGDTITIPVGDLVSGLQSEITSDNKLDADLVDDSTSTNKFVTSNEKTAWDNKQDALTAGNNISISGGVISATDTTYSDFVGADGTNAGTAGLVPAPAATDNTKFLKGDGTFSQVAYSEISGTPSLSGYQITANLVTSVSSSSTDSQYPSAKLFYDTCGDIETLINAL